MAFVDSLQFFKTITSVLWDWVEDFIDELQEMNLKVTVTRLYRSYRLPHSYVGVCIALFVLLLVWYFTSFIKSCMVNFARRARYTWESTVATKVDGIAFRFDFDDELTVDHRKATWELVKENVGIYALQGRRSTMEDRFTFVNKLDQSSSSSKISLYGIFDGHGGELSVEYVEKALFKKVMTKLLDGSLKHIQENDSLSRKEAIIKIIHNSYLEVDEALLNLLKSAYDGSGTTSVVAVLDGDTLYVSNLGDSRAVMCDQHLNDIPLSYDHKPDQPDERVRIEKAGGHVTYFGVWRVNGILATSRAFGDLSLKHNHVVSPVPDIHTFSVKEHKPLFMILATDGLWDVFSNAEAVRFIHTHLNESDFGAKSLANEAFARGSLDNISVIIVNLSVGRVGEGGDGEKGVVELHAKVD